MKAKFIKPKMIRILNSLSIDMIKIPRGEFIYKENNRKIYKIDYDIEVGKYPITVKEFEHFINNTGYITEAERGKGSYIWQINGVFELKNDANWKNPYFEQGDNNPVVCLTINDIKAYISWLNKKTGKPYRLPTEEEWEYMAFAMNNNPFGLNKNDILEDFAWFYDNSNAKTHPVGSKLSNKWGIYDIFGNVWEWCEPEALKGGSWGSVKRRMNILSKADRGNIHSDNKMGFRLVCSNYRIMPHSNDSLIKSDSILKTTSIDNEVKKAINKHQKIEQDVIDTLKNLGWSNNDILREDKKLNRYADIVLAIDGIEVAIIEIKVNIDISRNHKRYMQQLYKYAKQHKVSYAYITNGKKIYKYDIVNNLYKKVKNFPLKTELLFNLSKFYQSSNNIIESQIDGDFNGWAGETIFKLTNGQIWKQKRYAYYYTYKFMPKVKIYKSLGDYKMEVEDTNETIEVERIN